MYDTIQHVVEFRENLHRTFAFRSDATMDVIDAIAGNTSAKSVVGHSYSVLAALPEKKDRTSPPWVIPLLIQEGINR